MDRHLLEADIILELWALVLDPNWMHAQMKTGGLPAMKHDLRVLETSLETAKLETEYASDALSSIQWILKCLEAIPHESCETVRTLSFSLLAEICEQCRREATLGRLRNKIVSLMP